MSARSAAWLSSFVTMQILAWMPMPSLSFDARTVCVSIFGGIGLLIIAGADR